MVEITHGRFDWKKWEELIENKQLYATATAIRKYIQIIL
jgi:hypothetical protein